MMSTMLEVKNLFKVFGETPEDAFTLIEQGSIKIRFLSKPA